MVLARSRAAAGRGVRSTPSTDAAVAGDVRWAVDRGRAVACSRCGADRRALRAHLYFELGDLAALRIERDLVGAPWPPGSSTTSARSTPTGWSCCARRRANWGRADRPVTPSALGRSCWSTRVLLARLNPWLAAPAAVRAAARWSAAAARERPAESAPTRRAEDTRRGRHLLDLATDAPAAAKEIRAVRPAPGPLPPPAGLGRRGPGRSCGGARRADAPAAAGQARCSPSGTSRADRPRRPPAVAGQPNGRRRGARHHARRRRSNAQVAGASTSLGAAPAAHARRRRRTRAGCAPPRADSDPPGTRTAAPRPRCATASASTTCRFTLPGHRRRRCSTACRLDSRPAPPSRSSARTAPARRTLVKLLCRFYEPDRGRGHRGRRRPATPRPDSSGATAPPRLPGLRPVRAAGAGQTVGVGDLPRSTTTDAVLAALGRADAADVLDAARRTGSTPSWAPATTTASSCPAGSGRSSRWAGR